jgi:hypothetical protein
MTIQEIADVFGKSVTWVSQHLSLLKLDPIVQDMLVESEDNASHEGNGDAESQGRKLTMSLALLLINFPKPEQVSIAREIIKKDMSFVQARRYINQLARKRGYSAKAHGQKPKEQGNSLLRLAEHSIHSFGMYLDMRASELDAMTKGIVGNDRRILAKKLHKLSKDIDTLADGFDPE